MAKPLLTHIGSYVLTGDPTEEFPSVTGTVDYVGAGLWCQGAGSYVDTFGNVNGRYDGTTPVADSSGRGAVWGATVHLPSYGASGYVTLAAFINSPLYGEKQSELRHYPDGSLRVYRGGNEVATTGAGAFVTGDDVEWRYLGDGNTAGGNSSAKGHTGIRINGTAVVQVRDYVNGARNAAAGARGVDFCRFGILDASGVTGTPEVTFEHTYFGLTFATSFLFSECFHNAPDPDFLGVVEAHALAVDGSGGTAMLTGVGDSPNWECLDDVPGNGDTDYVTGGTTGGVPPYDDYTHASLAGAPTIVAVQPYGMAKRTAGTPSAGNSTALSVGPTGSVHASQTYRWNGYPDFAGDDQYVNPFTGLPWTLADVNVFVTNVAEPASVGSAAGFTWRLTSLVLHVLTGGTATTAAPAVSAVGTFVCPPAARQRSRSYLLA